LDAKVEKVRAGGRVEDHALVVAYGVDQSGQREVIGLEVGAAETEAFWRAFLRSLVRRGLAGVQLVVSDAHEGLEQAIAQVLGARWQRCTVHFLRDALGHCPKDLQPLVGAAIRPIFCAGSLEDARRLLGETVTHLEGRVPKVTRLLLEAEPDLLAFYGSPAGHRSKLRSTNPLERVNREIGRMAAPTWSACSPMTRPCSAWRAACSSSRTTNGWSAAVTSARPRWPSSPQPSRRPERSYRSRTPHRRR
jgi:putative transposase